MGFPNPEIHSSLCLAEEGWATCKVKKGYADENKGDFPWSLKPVRIRHT